MSKTYQQLIDQRNVSHRNADNYLQDDMQFSFQPLNYGWELTHEKCVVSIISDPANCGHALAHVTKCDDFDWLLYSIDTLFLTFDDEDDLYNRHYVTLVFPKGEVHITDNNDQIIGVHIISGRQIVIFSPTDDRVLEQSNDYW